MVEYRDYRRTIELAAGDLIVNPMPLPLDVAGLAQNLPGNDGEFVLGNPASHVLLKASDRRGRLGAVTALKYLGQHLGEHYYAMAGDAKAAAPWTAAPAPPAPGPVTPPSTVPAQPVAGRLYPSFAVGPRLDLKPVDQGGTLVASAPIAVAATTKLIENRLFSGSARAIAEADRTQQLQDLIIRRVAMLKCSRDGMNLRNTRNLVVEDSLAEYDGHDSTSINEGFALREVAENFRFSYCRAKGFRSIASYPNADGFSGERGQTGLHEHCEAVDCSDGGFDTKAGVAGNPVLFRKCRSQSTHRTFRLWGAADLEDIEAVDGTIWIEDGATVRLRRLTLLGAPRPIFSLNGPNVTLIVEDKPDVQLPSGWSWIDGEIGPHVRIAGFNA